MAAFLKNRKYLKRKNEEIDLDNFRQEKRFLSQQMADDLTELNLATEAGRADWNPGDIPTSRRRLADRLRATDRAPSRSPGVMVARRARSCTPGAILSPPSFVYGRPSESGGDGGGSNADNRWEPGAETWGGNRVGATHQRLGQPLRATGGSWFGTHAGVIAEEPPMSTTGAALLLPGGGGDAPVRRRRSKSDSERMTVRKEENKRHNRNALAWAPSRGGTGGATIEDAVRDLSWLDNPVGGGDEPNRSYDEIRDAALRQIGGDEADMAGVTATAAPPPRQPRYDDDRARVNLRDFGDGGRSILPFRSGSESADGSRGRPQPRRPRFRGRRDEPMGSVGPPPFSESSDGGGGGGFRGRSVSGSRSSTTRPTTASSATAAAAAAAAPAMAPVAPRLVDLDSNSSSGSEGDDEGHTEDYRLRPMVLPTGARRGGR